MGLSKSQHSSVFISHILLYIYMYICIYIYICICMCVCVYIYIYININTTGMAHIKSYTRFYICFSFFFPHSENTLYQGQLICCVVCGTEKRFKVHSYFCARVRRRMFSIVCGSASVNCWNKHLSTAIHSFIHCASTVTTDS